MITIKKKLSSNNTIAIHVHTVFEVVIHASCFET